MNRRLEPIEPVLALVATCRTSIRRLLLVCSATLTIGMLLLPQCILAQDVECIPPPAGKWCSSLVIPCYFGEGFSLWPLNPSFPLWIAIGYAIDEWNLELVATGYSLQNAGFCTNCREGRNEFPTNAILFEFVPVGTRTLCNGQSGDTAETEILPGDVPGSEISPIVKAVVKFNSNETWSNALRSSVARHELGHALGMGHVDRRCASVTLMSEGDCTGIERSIDGSALEGLQCLYGGGSCVQKFGIRLEVSDVVKFFRESCVCWGGCAPSTPMLASGERTYELAINDSGGPYEVFANLAETDWVDRTYNHHFYRSHTQALVRLRVFENGAVIDETYTTNPENISIPTSVSDDRPAADATRVFPNPFASLARIEFSLDRDEEVEVSIHDVAGRRLATLTRGRWSPGRHHVVLDRQMLGPCGGRSGVYFYSLRVGTKVERGRLLLVR